MTASAVPFLFNVGLLPWIVWVFVEVGDRRLVWWCWCVYVFAAFCGSSNGSICAPRLALWAYASVYKIRDCTWYAYPLFVFAHLGGGSILWSVYMSPPSLLQGLAYPLSSLVYDHVAVARLLGALSIGRVSGRPCAAGLPGWSPQDSLSSRFGHMAAWAGTHDLHGAQSAYGPISSIPPLRSTHNFTEEANAHDYQNIMA